jgi:hypothetical protein
MGRDYASGRQLNVTNEHPQPSQKTRKAGPPAREKEQRQAERKPPEIYNAGGSPNPILISGFSMQGANFDLSGTITVLNPTQKHVKIAPQRLAINGVDWRFISVAFHLRSNDYQRYDRISMLGNEKQDYNLHFIFSPNTVPKGMTGELWLTSSNREDEPFSILVNFA